MSHRQPLGIDLGTTYSAMATLEPGGRSTMLRNAEGEVLTPSVVFFDTDEIVVGKFAKRAVLTHPDRVAECAKRDMGRPHYARPIAGEQLPPEVIQACILKKLRRDAGPAMGGAGVVITVPAYFDEPRRKATADAAEMAGLDLLDIVNEPTAAALHFGEQLGFLTPGGTPREAQTVLVYDLGGGTFDVTVIALGPGDIRTLATDGDVELGGRDWDARLAQHAAAEFLARTGIDMRADATAMRALMIQAEQAKHTLTTRHQAMIHFEHQGRSAEIPVTREQFEELSGDLMERTSFTTRQVVAAAGLAFDRIDRVLLVGGSTRMPMVAQMLQQLTRRVPDVSLSPDEAVARGAAIYAGYLLSQSAGSLAPPPTFKVTDVNSHSLGIEGIDGQSGRRENVVVIPRNSPLPAMATERFATRSAAQRSIVVQVLEGESTQAELCTRIGRSVLKNLPAGLPQGTPVEIMFQYGTNGRLNVRAKVSGTQRALVIELEREGGLSDEGLHRWRQLLTGEPPPGSSSVAMLLAEALGARGMAAVKSPSSPPAAGSPPPPTLPLIPSQGPPAADLRPLSDARDEPPAVATPKPGSPLAAGSAPTGLTTTDAGTDPRSGSGNPAAVGQVQTTRRRRMRKWVFLLGHVVASTIGLFVGYIILCWFRPGADIFGLLGK